MTSPRDYLGIDKDNNIVTLNKAEDRFIDILGSIRFSNHEEVSVLHKPGELVITVQHSETKELTKLSCTRVTKDNEAS